MGVNYTPMTTSDIQTQIIQAARPEFVRMPKPGCVCPWCGLGRSHLYALAKEGKIKTLSLRKRGAARGVRLVKLDSVFAYLAKMEDGLSAGPGDGAAAAPGKEVPPHGRRP